MPAEQPSRTQNRNYDDDADWVDNTTASRATARTTGARPGLLIPKKTVAGAKPPNPDFKADDPDLIQSGMKVEHGIFGIGKIVHIEGASPNRKATVFFQETSEEKQLLLKFAKLRIVKGDE
jgi:DNA helicase-2/ATP-dependent DNA helicase PcrA